MIIDLFSALPDTYDNEFDMVVLPPLQFRRKGLYLWEHFSFSPLPHAYVYRNVHLMTKTLYVYRDRITGIHGDCE